MLLISETTMLRRLVKYYRLNLENKLDILFPFKKFLESATTL